jgi:hypothetical protein
MPETYKSFGTILGTTGATTIYPGVTGIAIVNGIVLSNVNSLNNTTATVELVKGATAYSLVSGIAIPFSSSLQAIDSPVVLESSNTLRASAGISNYIHVVVSVLEVT